MTMKSALAKSRSSQHRFCFSSLGGETLLGPVEKRQYFTAETHGTRLAAIVDFMIP